ncbi:MAG: hypothetical protein LC802_02560 [Acidobacteria bacterium]|nr:hypothetical protein [Acidobacteriota bacterium]
MSSLYAMQRANGDWFALEDHGHLRMPVFRNNREAMAARSRHSGMMLFKPVLLDARALASLVPKDGQSAAQFCLVDDPSLSLSRGHPLEHAQLALLVHKVPEQSEQFDGESVNERREIAS